MKLKHIHSRKVKELLEARGHKVEDTEKNKIYPKFDIYLFPKTQTLLDDLTDITNQMKK